MLDRLAPDGDVDGDIAYGDVDGITMRGGSWCGNRCWRGSGCRRRSWSRDWSRGGDRSMVMYASVAMALGHWAMRPMTHRSHMMTLWRMSSAIGVRCVSRRGNERS